MKATTPKQVLIAAKWIMEHFGWCQGSYYQVKTQDGGTRKEFDKRQVNKDNLAGCCLEGAINIVAADWAVRNLAISLVYYTIREKYLQLGNLPSFNDRPETTKEEVLDVLTQSIDKA